FKANHAPARWARAVIYQWQGKLEDALAEVYPLADQLPADYPETLNIRGDIYRSLGQLDAAAADYRRLIELCPREVNGHISLARISLQQGKVDEAKRWYDKLVTADPDAATSYLKRAEFRRDQGDFPGALADCDEATRKEKSPSVLPGLVRASIRAAQGDA